MGMTFVGTAETDLGELLEILPRVFDMKMAVQSTGWDKGKVRQAIIMGTSQDRLMPAARFTNATNDMRWENVAWRKKWITQRWTP
jgi:hypothetical protein